MTVTAEKPSPKVVRQHYWLIYGAALLAGVILLAEAFSFAPVQKLTARLGIALVYSALALIVGRERPSGIIAVALLWAAVIVTFFV